MWLYDGNIGYLSNKHTPLFIGALVCLVDLFLPYTLFLIFSQWLRSKSGQCRILFWVNHYRVLPFLDAYHAPYTDKHRYWTGLMLLVRCALFLLFAFNALGDPSIAINLLAIGCHGYCSTSNCLCPVGKQNLQDLVLECIRIVLYRQSECCYVHLYQCSLCNIHWHCYLPLSSVNQRYPTAMEEIVPTI